MALALMVSFFRCHSQACLSHLNVNSAQGALDSLAEPQFPLGAKCSSHVPPRAGHTEVAWPPSKAIGSSPSGLPMLPSPQLCLPAPGSATLAPPPPKAHPFSDCIRQKRRNNTSIYGTFNTYQTHFSHWCFPGDLCGRCCWFQATAGKNEAQRR